VLRPFRMFYAAQVAYSRSMTEGFRQERNSGRNARRHYMLYLAISDTLALALADIATA